MHKFKNLDIQRQYNREIVKFNQGLRKTPPTIKEIENFFSKNPSLADTTGRLQYFYLVVFENGVKFGRTVSTKSRFANYDRPWCLPIIKTYIYDCPYADKAELLLRRKYRHRIKTLSSEFITGSNIGPIVKDAEEIVKLLNTRKKIEIK